MRTHDKGRTLGVILEKLKGLGYTVYHKVLNTLDYGMPQKRERIYIVGFLEPIGFNFPKAKKIYKPLSEILDKDEDVLENYFLSDRLKEKRMKAVKPNPPYPSIWHENIGGNISALPYSCALRAGGSYNYLVVNGIRRLTGREMLRLQGFPEDFIINIPYTQVRKVAGNSVTVPVIKAIAGEMMKALEEKRKPRFEGVQLTLTHDRSNFQLSEFIDAFWREPGLRRSIDKVYEIVVYALFSAIVESLDLKVKVSYNPEKGQILEEFKDFADKIIRLDAETSSYETVAKIYRVGVTNAADRGLDMWANFGLAIQIKHLH